MNAEELKDYRIARLSAAVDKVCAGNKSEFGRKLGYTDGAFVRQMLAGTRPITEKTVMQVEALHGMGEWFAEGRAGQDDREQSFDLLTPDQIHDLLMTRLQDVQKLADSLLRATQKTEPTILGTAENGQAKGGKMRSLVETPQVFKAHGNHHSLPAKKAGNHK